MSRMNEACHIWMRHVTYEWGMLHMNEACYIWMRHVTYEWGMLHMNEACYIWMRHVTYEWGMLHMNEACCISLNNVTYEWVVLRMNMNENEYECVWIRTIRPLPCTNRYTHEWGKSNMNEACHTWISHVTYEWVMSQMNINQYEYEWIW